MAKQRKPDSVRIMPGSLTSTRGESCDSVYALGDDERVYWWSLKDEAWFLLND